MPTLNGIKYWHVSADIFGKLAMRGIRLNISVPPVDSSLTIFGSEALRSMPFNPPRSFLREYCHSHGRMPRNRKAWRTWCTDGLVLLLRLVNGQWPPPRPARRPEEARAEILITEYRRWLQDCRGLAISTIDAAIEETRRFLIRHIRHCQSDALRDLSLPQVHEYMRLRAAGMRRTTLKAVSHKVSGFLRFLHQRGHFPFDLSGRMIRPTLYAFESIPSILRPPRSSKSCRLRGAIDLRAVGVTMRSSRCWPPMACAPARLCICSFAISTGVPRRS
jgi:hypothetical protein